jgi:hypothetical protein
MESILSNQLTPTIFIPTIINIANKVANRSTNSCTTMSQAEYRITSTIEKQTLILLAYQLINPEVNHNSKIAMMNKRFYQSTAQLAILVMMEFLILQSQD